MPRTVIGKVPKTGSVPGTDLWGPEFPRPVAAPIIKIRSTWNDEWEYRPELEFSRGNVLTAAAGQASCEITRRYGNVKSPYETEMPTDPANPDVSLYRKPLELLDYWVQVELVTEQGEEVVWVGRISSEAREVFASSEQASGIQTWVAQGPLSILRKREIYRSYWWQDGWSEEQDIGWLPGMNARDSRNVLVGNRSTAKHDGCYLYGGSELWSHYDYLEYLLVRFVDASAYNEPEWQIGGQIDILQNLYDIVDFGESASVAEMLRRLIPPELGLDFKIVPLQESPGGFEVQVFALSNIEHSFGTATMPRNPNAVDIRAGESPDIVRIRVVDSLDQQYDRINVIGGRVVVCCSLRASWGDMVPKWSQALQDAYDGADDEGRLHDRFEGVYRDFGAPVDWTAIDGFAAPTFDDEGLYNGLDGERQTQVRRTLPWLPLLQGFDYSTNPATDQNPAGYSPGPMAPRAWIYDPDSERYVLVDELGFSVHALLQDWGVRVEFKPNHRGANNHFNANPVGGTDAPADTPALYDYDTLITTIAFETDQRLALRHELTSGASPIGNELNISVPEAELWYLADGTAVTASADGTYVNNSGAGRELRNDAGKLAMIMAGAIARYYMQRTRVEIVYKGLWAMGGLVGQILDVLEEGVDARLIKAPITSVEWIGGNDPVTIVRAGFAA